MEKVRFAYYVSLNMYRAAQKKNGSLISFFQTLIMYSSKYNSELKHGEGNEYSILASLNIITDTDQ